MFSPAPSLQRLRGLRQRLRPRVVAVFVVAEDLAPQFLGELLDQIWCAARRALLVDGPVPEDEIAIRIVRTAEKHLASARLAFDDVAALVAVFRTLDAGGLVLDVAAFGVL